MCKITATGVIMGSEPDTVIVETAADGVRVTASDRVKDILKGYLEHIPPMGGTCYLERREILAYYSIFVNSDLFRGEPKIEITGELPTIEYEKDLIY